MTQLAILSRTAFALLLAAGAGHAMAATPTAATAGKDAAPVQLAQANTSATPGPTSANVPLVRNADGQIETLRVRNWSNIDRNSDGLVSPEEMQSYLEKSWR